MQITEITIHPTNEKMVKAYATICFDNCFLVQEITVIKSTMGLFVSFPAKKQRDGTHRDLAFPANAKTRRMIQQAIWRSTRKSLPRTTEKFRLNRAESTSLSLLG
jgi:stage V sporulation protein G